MCMSCLDTRTRKMTKWLQKIIAECWKCRMTTCWPWDLQQAKWSTRKRLNWFRSGQVAQTWIWVFEHQATETANEMKNALRSIRWEMAHDETCFDLHIQNWWNFGAHFLDYTVQKHCENQQLLLRSLVSLGFIVSSNSLRHIRRKYLKRAKFTFRLAAHHEHSMKTRPTVLCCSGQNPTRLLRNSRWGSQTSKLSDFRPAPMSSNHESVDVQSLQGFEGRKRDFEGCLCEFSDSNPVRILTFNSFWRFSWPAALSEEKLAALEPLVEAARVIQSQGPSQILLKQSSSRNVKSWARVTQSHWGYKPSSLPKSVPVDDEESLHLVFGKHWIEAVPLLRCRWCIYGQTIQHEAKTRSNKSIIATQTTSYHSFIWIQHMIR